MVENELEFLFAGFAVFWAGLFVYLIILQARIRDLQRELEQLEERLEEAEDSSAHSQTNAQADPAPPRSSAALADENAPTDTNEESKRPAGEAGTGA